MTTAFQPIIDTASQLSINRRKRVGTSIARDGTVKATSLGGQLWQFEVTPPNGARYTELRQLIEAAEALDRTTVGQIQINNPGHSYISGYQGNLVDPELVTVSYTTGNTLTITGGVTGLGPGDYVFRAGDLIQLVGGSVYSVAADVAHDATTITVNRPIRETTGAYSLKVGPNCVFDVICVQFPDWTLFGYDQVSWSGPFVFVEAN